MADQLGELCLGRGWATEKIGGHTSVCYTSDPLPEREWSTEKLNVAVAAVAVAVVAC